MSEPGVRGSDWTRPEIDLVVADYFRMREKFFRGDAFIKARHYESIMREIGRTKGSIELKYMNISATLERLSLPWLKGYVPRHNFQGALLDAVERYVEREWDIETAIPPEENSFQEDRQIFIEAPPETNTPLISDNAKLERMARRFDPALRDERNRKTGLAGERRAYHSEIARLTNEGRPDLAKKVVWTSQELGDGAGYDILSFDNDGSERFLEVKTTIGHKRTPFYLSKNECDFARDAKDCFRIYRLYEWGSAPRAFLIRTPLEDSLTLEPSAYRASFG